MNIVKKISFLTLILMTSNSIAHSKATGSIPANGELLSQSPTELVLMVARKSRLLKLEVSTEEGQAIDIRFEPIVEPATTFIVPVQRLNPGAYHLKWVIMGKDTHRVVHEATFSISPESQ